MMPYTIMVTGSRFYTDVQFVHNVLDRYSKDHLPDVHLIEGGAGGADRIARKWAIRNNVTFTTFQAEWDKYGRLAGPLRNQRMVDSNPDICLAFPHPGSKGTHDAINRARNAGIETLMFN